jgi:gas vesicle protein
MADNTGSFVLGFWLGALTGAAAALLLAPEAGDETRRQLQMKSIELRNQVQTQAGQLAEQAKTQADVARTQAQQVAGQAKQQAQQAQVRGRVVLAEGVKKAQQAVESAQQKIVKPGDEVTGATTL